LRGIRRKNQSKGGRTWKNAKKDQGKQDILPHSSFTTTPGTGKKTGILTGLKEKKEGGTAPMKGKIQKRTSLTRANISITNKREKGEG